MRSSTRLSRISIARADRMHSYDLILTLTAAFCAALVFGYITRRLRLSPIVGYRSPAR